MRKSLFTAAGFQLHASLVKEARFLPLFALLVCQSVFLLHLVAALLLRVTLPGQFTLIATYGKKRRIRIELEEQ